VLSKYLIRLERKAGNHAYWLSLMIVLAGVFPASIFGQPEIGERRDFGELSYDKLNEVSGIAASRKNPGIFWLHNDSGDGNFIYAINSTAQLVGIYEVIGAKERDWEDIAIGPGPAEGQQYLYIGNFGDNDAEYPIKHIYRVMEPRVLPNQEPRRIKLYGTQDISFVFPDGKRDAETLMVDPLNLDIYVVSKREEKVGVYRAPYPQPVGRPTPLKLVTRLPLSWIVAGDISADGREILLKTYDAIYYWERKPGESIADALNKPSHMLPYFLEPQGEAIAWKADGMGYFTVSEEYKKIPAHLYFYPRIPEKK